MEGGKTVSVGAVYVPNCYTIHLGNDDFGRFEGLIPTLRDEFAALLRRSATDRRWQFAGPLVVNFTRDQSVVSGRFEVDADHDSDAVAPAPVETRERDIVRLSGAMPPKEWVLDSARMVMGRLPTCNISLNDPNASRQHAELVLRDDGWWIVDLDSTNGTFVNGSLVKERRLAPGDMIQVGSSRLEFAREAPRPAPAMPKPGVPEPTQVASNPLNAD